MEYEELSSVVHPLAQSYDHGMDFYMDAVEYTYSKINSC